MDRHDDHFADEEARRREAQDRRDRQLEHAPIGDHFRVVVHPRDAAKARMIIEPKDGSDIPPDVAARQDSFYRRLLGLPPRRDV